MMKVLISEKQLQERISELALQISKDYAGEKLLVVCTLKGATLFFADLVRKIELPLAFDFIIASSYEGNTSKGEVKIIKDIDCNIHNQNVLIIEDIVDTGITLHSLVNLLMYRNPKTLKTCTLLDKKSQRTIPIDADYIGFEIGNKFVVGYGLDFNQQYRNLPYIGVIEQEFSNE